MNFRNISAWSIRNPVVPIVLFIGLVLMGVVSFMQMKIQDMPDIEFPAVFGDDRPARRGADRDRDPDHPAGRIGGAHDQRGQFDQFVGHRRQQPDLRDVPDRHRHQRRGQRGQECRRSGPRRIARGHSRAAGEQDPGPGRGNRRMGDHRRRHDGRAALVVRRRYRLQTAAFDTRHGRGHRAAAA